MYCTSLKIVCNLFYIIIINHFRGYGAGLGVAAVAEAYVADYMRTMQHQLPPLPPYGPHPYDTLPPPPPPPR